MDRQDQSAAADAFNPTAHQVTCNSQEGSDMRDYIDRTGIFWVVTVRTQVSKHTIINLVIYQYMTE